MNDAHFHLVTNHLPVVGVLFAVLLLLYAAWRKSDEAKTIAFGFSVLVGLLSMPGYFSGEGAEEFIEDLKKLRYLK